MASLAISQAASSLFASPLPVVDGTAGETVSRNSGVSLPLPSRRRSSPAIRNSGGRSVVEGGENGARIPRRSLLWTSGTALLAPLLLTSDAQAEASPKLCDETCEKVLESAELVTTESGLQYKDVIVGTGASPPVGFQVAANYVASVGGKVFDSSLEKGIPYIFRVGAGQVIPGLDEGILSMKVGGLRRLYIPGPLAFPKGLPSGPGRPRVLPNSPVVFDVSLVYVPGLDDDEE